MALDSIYWHSCSIRKGRRNQITCCCSGYHFPHRQTSLSCDHGKEPGIYFDTERRDAYYREKDRLQQIANDIKNFMVSP